MPSYAHQKIVDEIRRLDAVPGSPDAYATWIQAGAHLDFLRRNADSDEIVVYTSGEYSFVYAAVIPNEALDRASEDDRMAWDGRPDSHIASYVYGGGRDHVWLERQGESDPDFPERPLARAKPLVFSRTFEGWAGAGGDYYELNQEYTHVTGIHWRPEQRGYCRYNRNGDLEHIVSVTSRAEKPGDVACITFAWEPLEEYLAAARSTLVRRFDFTLLKRESFGGWSDGPEDVVHDDRLSYRQKLMPGYAAYTVGVQLITPRRPLAAIFRGLRGDRADRQYAEFITWDWRNRCIVKLSAAPGASTNYFEAKKNSLPFELSPAFFRPEVILKYKTDKDKYTIRGRDITCRNAWTLRAFDVNEAGQIFAYVCYLRDLPYEEQLHWASYNERPKAGISERARVHDFEGQFVTFREPLQEVLSTLRLWHEQRASWWKLRDERLLERVSTPLTSSRDEWAEAFLDLAKLVVEGFDTAVIRSRCDETGITYDARDQSIALLERLLNAGGGSEKQSLSALRAVQLIRTKVKSHAVGEEGEALAHEAIEKHGSFTKHFKDTCEGLSLELQAIGGAFS